MERELVCIVCPKGCLLKAECEGSKLVSVTGNTCKRGLDYAESECTDPRRSVTTTVACDNGQQLSVKTEGTIRKDDVMECVKALKSVVAKAPIKIGDVIVEDICGTRILATSNAEK